MTTDPIQALIDAGAIPSNPFGPNSRYAGTGFGLFRTSPSDPGITYVLRRFIAQQADIPVIFEHVVRAGERPDLLAFQVYGDPELYWRIADANAVTDPFEMTDTLAASILIPSVPGT